MIVWLMVRGHFWVGLYGTHYSGVIMGAMASQITGITIVYSTVYSGADQRKYQSSASLAFVCGEFTGDRWIPRTNGQWRGKCFHLMTSSYCKQMPRITSQEVGWRVGAVIQALTSASKLAVVSYSITIQPRTSNNSERHHWLMHALVLP